MCNVIFSAFIYASDAYFPGILMRSPRITPAMTEARISFRARANNSRAFRHSLRLPVSPSNFGTLKKHMQSSEHVSESRSFEVKEKFVSHIAKAGFCVFRI